MLWTIAIILALLWGLGLVTATTFGGYIHIVLGVALLLVLVAAFRAGAHAQRRRSERHPPPAAPGGSPQSGHGPA